MSRHTANNSRYQICYGIDRAPAIGAFVQVFDNTDPDEPLVDLDGLGGVAVTSDMVIKLACDYVIPIDTDTVRQVMSADPPRFEQAPVLRRICDDVLAQIAKKGPANG